MKSLFSWFKKLISGQPHFRIGSPESPYLLRWYLIPRNRWLNVYLHKFLRSDDDRALHDHPWWFVSIMVRGSYRETLQREVNLGWLRGPQPLAETTNERSAPSIAYRDTAARHRVELPADMNGKPVPCWTIVITGRSVRNWGFWCPQGFVPWQQFVEHTDHGNIGRGCGEMDSLTPAPEAAPNGPR